MTDRVLVTGGNGLIGHALQNILGTTKEIIYPTSKDCDLRDEIVALNLFKKYRPRQVYHLAAHVGGIAANSEYLADFFEDNIRINTNVLSAARRYGTEKLVSVLSTCIFPVKDIKYPLTVEQLQNGEPHSTNFAYAYSKRMVDVFSRALREQYGCNFITVISNNLFGPHDNFDLRNSHVIPALIRKFYEAKKENKDFVELWGTGKPQREFTYSKDFAKILVYVMEHYDGVYPVNVGNTEQYTIKSVAQKVAKMIGFEGFIRWNSNKPDGVLKKPSSNKEFLKLGWRKTDYTDFDKALAETVGWFQQNYPKCRGI